MPNRILKIITVPDTSETLTQIIVESTPFDAHITRYAESEKRKVYLSVESRRC